MLLISISAFTQNIDSSFVGKYTDGIGDMIITEICLRENGTFHLKTPDPIFPYTHQTFENEGIWISRNDSVILNPELNQLKTEVTIKENTTDQTDSVSLNVRYFVDYFQSDSSLKREEKEFEVMTICINKKRKYFNLVRYPHIKMCAFAPKVKKQVLIDSTNTFKIPQRDLFKIGVFTYGFDSIVWVNVSDKNSNYLELEIIQQVDIERTPRNRELIIDGDKIYFYKRNGKIDKSLSILTRK
jgi:hypothetical protein